MLRCAALPPNVLELEKQARTVDVEVDFLRPEEFMELTTEEWSRSLNLLMQSV